MLSLCFIRATPSAYSFALSMPNHVLSVLEAAYLKLNIDDPPQVRFLTSWWRRGGSVHFWRSLSRNSLRTSTNRKGKRDGTFGRASIGKLKLACRDVIFPMLCGNNKYKCTLRCLPMAKNTRIGYRRGAVDNRSQTYNPVIEQWVKRDAQTGQFMDVKQNGEPFKGIRS